MNTFSATTTKLPESCQVEAASRGFKLMIDEPVDAGGTDKGMNPVEMLLCALGGCQTLVACINAPKLGIELSGCRAELEGDMDLSGQNPYNGYQEIRSTLHVKSCAPQEKLDELAAVVEHNCPVGNTLKGSCRVACRVVADL